MDIYELRRDDFPLWTGSRPPTDAEREAAAADERRYGWSGEEIDLYLNGMVVVCSWCPDARARTEAATAFGRVVTHGMCSECAETFLREGRF